MLLASVTKMSAVLHTGLSDGDNILALKNSGNGVALDRSRQAILGELDVFEDNWMKTSIIEL